MEIVSATAFIGAVIVAIVELLKALNSKDYKTAVTIFVAGVVGGVIGGIDIHIGIENISVAQGVLIGLASSGAYKVASKIG